MYDNLKYTMYFGATKFCGSKLPLQYNCNTITQTLSLLKLQRKCGKILSSCNRVLKRKIHFIHQWFGTVRGLMKISEKIVWFYILSKPPKKEIVFHNNIPPIQIESLHNTFGYIVRSCFTGGIQIAIPLHAQLSIGHVQVPWCYQVHIYT